MLKAGRSVLAGCGAIIGPLAGGSGAGGPPRGRWLRPSWRPPVGAVSWHPLALWRVLGLPNHGSVAPNVQKVRFRTVLGSLGGGRVYMALRRPPGRQMNPLDTTFRMVYQQGSTSDLVKHAEGRTVSFGRLRGHNWSFGGWFWRGGGSEGSAASAELAAPGGRGVLAPPRAQAGPGTPKPWISGSKRAKSAV